MDFGHDFGIFEFDAEAVAAASIATGSKLSMALFIGMPGNNVLDGAETVSCKLKKRLLYVGDVGNRNRRRRNRKHRVIYLEKSERVIYPP